MCRLGWLLPTLYILFLMLPTYWLVSMSFKTTNETLSGSGYELGLLAAAGALIIPGAFVSYFVRKYIASR